MPKVSIIIPIYNVEKYLVECLDSVVNQTLKDIEIICINDNSKDNSLEILNNYAKNDSRFKIINLTQNSGASVARNKGLEIAKGEYIGFVDSDDEIEPNFYEELYKKAKETNSDITKGNCKVVDYDGKEHIENINNLIKENKYNYIWQFTCSIYRSEFLKGNNINFPDECTNGEDIVFLQKAVVLSNKIGLIDNVYYIYKRRENSLDSRILTLQTVKSKVLSRKLYHDFFNTSGLFEKDRIGYNYIYLHKLCNHFQFLLRTNEKEGKRLFIDSLIESYWKCLDKEHLDKYFPYQWILPYIKNKEAEKLTEILLKYKKESDFIYSPNFLERIFSIKLNPYRKKKIITIFGVRLSIKAE